MNPDQFKALTFDCYGTLIDWESGILSVLRPWAQARGLSVGDDSILGAFAQAEPIVESENATLPYRQLLPLVFDRIAESFAQPGTLMCVCNWEDRSAHGHRFRIL